MPFTKGNSGYWLGKKRPDMVGHPKWNFTNWDHKAVMTDEVKQKISETKMGKSLSPEHRAKLLATAKRGADHPNWRGGTQSKDHLQRVKFRKTMQQKVFQRDNYTCQICDTYGGSIQVDHIKRWSEYPELRFDLDNCRTLCMACHYYVTFKRKLPQGVIWGHNFSRRISKLAS